MNFILCHCSDTLRDVAKERKSSQLFNVTDFHILPLRTTIFMIKQVGSAHSRLSLSSGKVHFHDALEVLRGYCTNSPGLIRCRTITTSEDRASHHIERIAPARGASDVLNIAFQ